MVYCGKLSKKCLPCRKRKLQCDLRIHGCSQCARANLICSGYRDTKTLRFRDETNAVKKKVTTRKSTGTVCRSVSVPICDQAKELFYYNYVIGVNKPFHFLQALYSPASKFDFLNRSIDAVALAYFGYQRHLSGAEEHAREQYVSALSLTNAAIRDPYQAREDTTMLAILLLDLYEKMSNGNPIFHGAWATHLSGALALVKIRGREQFQQPNVVSMLTRLTTNLVISCVASGRPVPSDVVALRSEIALRVLGPTDPKWQETDLMIKFCCLRQQMREGSFPDDEIISSLISLDSEFAKLAAGVPSTWQYKTVHVGRKSRHHYDSFHHIYPAEHVAQMWNTLRLTRIALNEMIFLRCLDNQVNVTHSVTSLQQHATAVIRDMAADICATVPQYIDSARQPECAERTHKGEPQHPVDDQTNLTHQVPCYRLIFPLFIVARSPRASNVLRKWAIKQLHFMADNHAIRNAAAIAENLESGKESHPWHIYAMLGSYAFVC